MTIILEGHFADRTTWSLLSCPIAKALAAIGPPSAVLVLGEAYFGTSRFGDFVRNLGMTESAVTARLSHLVSTGLLSKEPYKEPGQRTRYEYHLTKMGRDLLPTLVSLMEWGDTYLQGAHRHRQSEQGRRQSEQGRQVTLTHAGCDEAVSAEVRCSAGHLVGMDGIVMRPAEDPRQSPSPQAPVDAPNKEDRPEGRAGVGDDVTGDAAAAAAQDSEDGAALDPALQ